MMLMLWQCSLYNQVLHRSSELNLLPAYSTTMTAISAIEFVHHACNIDATLDVRGKNALRFAETGLNALHRRRWKLADILNHLVWTLSQTSGKMTAICPVLTVRRGMRWSRRKSRRRTSLRSALNGHRTRAN